MLKERLGVSVLGLIRAYCAVADTASLVRTVWETPQFPDSPAKYAFDANELVSTIQDLARQSPEFEAFRSLVLSEIALRDFFHLESEQYVTFPDQVFFRANTIARYYFSAIRFNDSPRFIAEEANNVRELVESEFATGQVDTIGLALLGGMITDGIYDLECSAQIRPPSTYEFESFFNGWSTYSTPDLITRAQILQSHALIEIRKRMARADAARLMSPAYDDYILAINLGVGDCYLIQKRLIVKSAVFDHGHEIASPTQKFILHPGFIDGAGMERVREYLNLLRTGINRRRISVAINRLSDGIRRPSTGDAFVDYMVGIESIVTSNERGEVNFKVALRLAALVAFGRDDALFLLKDIKRLYGVRSRILHGDSVSTVDADTLAVRLLLTRAVVMVLRMEYNFEPGLIDQALLKYLYAAAPRNRPVAEVLVDLSFRLARVVLTTLVDEARRKRERDSGETG